VSANIIIDFWMEKARDDLASALDNASPEGSRLLSEILTSVVFMPFLPFF